jgi:protein pelota
MKILKKDIRHGEVFLEAEDLDDLWYLSQLIDAGDVVKSLTQRKIKLSDKDGTSSAAFKKTVLLSITVEKLGFHEYTDVLRVSGTVNEAAEDIPSGSHHTLSIEPSTKLTIIKQRWLKYQLERLDEASKDKGSEILICAFDREEAYFAILTKQGYRILAELSGEMEKKADTAAQVKDFYGEIIQLLLDYSTRYNIKSIILASPAFWKEDLLKKIEDKSLRSKITLATCNAVGKSAIAEILRRPEIKNVLKNERNSRELELVEKLLEAISKNGPVAYGLKDTKVAVEASAVQTLLITTSFISERKESDSFGEVNQLMLKAESMSGSVVIINSSNDAGKHLDGLSGIAALLRYRLN